MIPVTGIILAGGHSRRMGRNKALLTLGGQTLLERQTEKLRQLEITDILISGGNVSLPGTRLIPDQIPERGPLGGLHACLLHAFYPSCLVLCVDAPMVSRQILKALLETALNSGRDATVLEYNGKLEPLVGVYRAELAERIACHLRGDDHSVHSLLHQINARYVALTGAAEVLSNCNTPEEFRELQASYLRKKQESFI